jgi:hypothetical protein
MMLFSQALSAMARDDAFEPRPAAEAKQSDVETSEDAAISRLPPIQDGFDYWQEHRRLRVRAELDVKISEKARKSRISAGL